MTGIKNFQTLHRVAQYAAFPNSLFLRRILPVCYVILLQLLTGIPKPNTLENRDFNEFAVTFASQIFDYPFWIQDLSHFPLFFILAWFSQWFWQEGTDSSNGTLNPKAIIFSVFFSIFNELIQAFIPDRFPSVGDLLMNLLGVCVGTYVFLHVSKLTKNHL